MIKVGRRLDAALLRWVRQVRAHAVPVLWLCAAASAGLFVYAAGTLGIDSDTIELFPEDLPARRNHTAFVADFPNLENALFVVVDAETPELVRDASGRLLAALQRDHDAFEDVYVPGGGAFFEHNALLYASVDELEMLSDELVRFQPIIGELERDGSLANLSALIQEGLDRVGSDAEAGAEAEWSLVLDRMSDASVEVYAEYPLAVSWEAMLLRGTSIEVSTRQVIVAHPILDFAQLVPASKSIAAVRETARRLDLSPLRGVTVRITGNPALVEEETLGLLWDVAAAGVVSFMMVTVILGVALRSVRIVAHVCLTLLTGMVWTAAFAAAAVGNLNVISIAAAVMFVGLGVDFAIHLCMRYVDLREQGREEDEAWDRTVGEVGRSLVICTVTTSIGFFAFLPTDYRGVAELGLITGTGLIIILMLTLTMLPALLTAFPLPAEALSGRRLRFSRRLPDLLRPHARGIRWLAAAAAPLALLLLPAARFEPNIVAMRDQSTESVRTFRDLLADAGDSSPWHVNSVAPNLAAADALKKRLAKLDVVRRSISLSDYIPDQQEEKLEILEDLAFLMDTPAAGGARASHPAPVEEEIAALTRLRDFLARSPAAEGSSALSASVTDLRAKLDTLLERVQREGDPAGALAQLETVLLSNLPTQIARLRRGLEPSLIRRETLPPRLLRRMLSSEGRARVQTFPSEDLNDYDVFARFVDAVQEIDPNATGVAVNLVEFARTTLEAFRQAFASALLVISLILWLLWRRVREVALVLAPLLLAALLTGAAVVVIDMPFNFFNIIVIPLLLGAGVDSGIHLVQRARSGGDEQQDLLATTAARAVFFSALTTITSFGTLGFSAHVGLSSLGVLLTTGMFLTLLCNLILLPALLEWWRPSR